MERARFTVTAAEAGERLDRLVAARLELISRARAQKLIRAGAVRLDGEVADKPSRAVTENERVDISHEALPAPAHIEPEPIPLTVLYEDDDLAVIDKTAGMVVHPAPGNWSGTLVHALLHRFGGRLADSGSPARPGIVHRLDKGTSGLIVVALNSTSHEALSRQFADRSVNKEYLAVVYGRPRGGHGVVDIALGRDRRDRKKISSTTARPRDAVTEWEVLEEFPGLALVRAQPKTGRTHQIRAHMAWLRHPIVGDDTYAGQQWKGIPEGRIRSALAGFARPALHAWRLEFDHPRSAERQRFEVPVPADLAALLSLLRNWRDGAK